MNLTQQDLYDLHKQLNNASWSSEKQITGVIT